MPRLHPLDEQEILLRHIRQLLSTFPTTTFLISDLESVGNTARRLINEQPFWSDRTTVLEAMACLKTKRVVTFTKLDWTTNKQFEVIPENIPNMVLYRTPNDILTDMYTSLKSNLPHNYNPVLAHLRDAEKILSTKDAHDYSEVGLKCLAAYEDFLDILIDELEIEDTPPKDKTLNRLSKVLATVEDKDGRLSKLIMALDAFQEASHEYNQKLKHRTSASKNVTYEQAERTFLYTFLIIKEVYYFVTINKV